MLREELGKKLRYKDMLRHHLHSVGINQDNWESLMSDRLVWRKKVSTGLNLLRKPSLEVGPAPCTIFHITTIACVIFVIFTVR